jgi:hypothetical protein
VSHFSLIISFRKYKAKKKTSRRARCYSGLAFPLSLISFGGLPLKNYFVRKGRREGASGVLVRLVSLWWEFPPRLDSNNNIPRPQKQQFFVFQNNFS